MTLHYDRPGTAARSFNAAIRHLAELGISVAGSRALRVRGRTSGVMRGVVVNVLRVDGVDYVISARHHPVGAQCQGGGCSGGRPSVAAPDGTGERGRRCREAAAVAALSGPLVLGGQRTHRRVDADVHAR